MFTFARPHHCSLSNRIVPYHIKERNESSDCVRKKKTQKLMEKKRVQLFIFKIRRVSFVFLLFDESLSKSFGIVTSVYICMSSRLSVCLNHVSTITKLDYFPY